MTEENNTTPTANEADELEKAKKLIEAEKQSRLQKCLEIYRNADAQIKELGFKIEREFHLRGNTILADQVRITEL